MTALVSFDRVFEVLDLKPLIEDRPGATRCRGQPRTRAGPAAAAAGRAERRRRGHPGSRARAAARRPEIEFDHVSFRYPAASEVSLASLESIALPAPEHADASQDVLSDVTFQRAGRAAHRAGRAVGRGQDHDHAPGVAAV